MFWRYLDEDHPAARDVPKAERREVIQDLYQRMDKLIGRVMEKIDDNTLLMVISDHGFKSFAALHEPERMAASERLSHAERRKDGKR